LHRRFRFHPKTRGLRHAVGGTLSAVFPQDCTLGQPRRRETRHPARPTGLEPPKQSRMCCNERQIAIWACRSTCVNRFCQILVLYGFFIMICDESDVCAENPASPQRGSPSVWLANCRISTGNRAAGRRTARIDLLETFFVLAAYLNTGISSSQ
jgi:hypothetical protein